MKRISLKGALNNEEGFSLTELAIALSVIAFFAGIVYLAAQPYLEKSKYLSYGEQLTSITSAITSYYGDHGEHPTAFGSLTNGKYLPVVPNPARWLGMNCAMVVGRPTLYITALAQDQFTNVKTAFEQQCETVSEANPGSGDGMLNCHVTWTANCSNL